ncbi:MAG: hypothetical protein J6B12_05930 [Clostridia bacterium]|nr:hypothetical protein [Clostridia bacterium]
MILSIYRKALAIIAQKPFRLLGVAWLSSLLSLIVSILFGAVIGVALAINLAISTSMTLVFLRGYRGITPRAVDLFYCLKDWQTAKRVICGMAWQTLWIFLWALIPLVGWIIAIVKAYSWRLTPYILANEPTVPATQAIHVSAQRTYGYRGAMFGADILVYVCIFIISFVLSLLANIPYIGGTFLLLYILFSLTSVLLSPLFVGLVKAAFYEEIMAKPSSKASAEENGQHTKND